MKFHLSILPIITVLLLVACDPDATDNEDILRDASAHWAASDRLIWAGAPEAARYELRYSHDADILITPESVENGSAIPLEPESYLDEELADQFRHISDEPVFELNEEDETLRSALQGQIIAVAYDENDTPLHATQVQPHGVIDNLFTYHGELGPVYENNSITAKVWAPTAQSVTLELYDAEKNHTETVTPNLENPQNGVWEFTGDETWDRSYYRFSVEVYHPENNAINEFEVTDPWSVSLATDSHYSQFVDLAGDTELKPEGWDHIRKEQPRPVDITVYEAHMRDFSLIDESIPQEHRATYMAFTHNGMNGRDQSEGMRHLNQLQEAGLTHLHLLPINDIATVKENPENRVDVFDPYDRICDIVDHPDLQEYCDQHGDQIIWEVFEDLAEDDPATEDIQKPYSLPGRMEGMAWHDGFNWGYDPFHFNVPQGSYSTDPDGTRRILETRKMVQALDEIGLYTVIDVVYNHTFASGPESRFSVLDKIVPGYYHRFDAVTGEIETSTCCDNTAAEFNMMEKLIIDSVKLWAKHYKIDSFRFDLMGHHPRYVMENLQDSLATLTLDEHGVDGENLYIYGEGWNFGEVADDRIFDQATQFNMGTTGIGNFNDRLRDGVRGGNFTDTGRHQGFANGQYLFPNQQADEDRDNQLESLLYDADRIRVGMAGNLSDYPFINRTGDEVTGGEDAFGFASLPQESVNYIDKHDNETLWDNTQTKLPDEMSMEERVRVHMLSNAFINFGQGVPFYQMGSDILRSKSLDRNSFDSGDWYNAIDFTLDRHLWGQGLPPAWDNEERWDEMREFKANENITVESAHMERANQLFREQLEIRYSSPLFRLESADEVNNRLAFHNTGPDQHPGIIAMTISDGVCAGEPIDDELDGILVVFNADNEEQSIDLGLDEMELHESHLYSVDELVQSASFEDGVATVPALTAAVFVQPQGEQQGEFICNEF